MDKSVHTYIAHAFFFLPRLIWDLSFNVDIECSDEIIYVVARNSAQVNAL